MEDGILVETGIGGWDTCRDRDWRMGNCRDKDWSRDRDRRIYGLEWGREMKDGVLRYRAVDILGHWSTHCSLDIDECEDDSHNCHQNAICTNGFGYFNCTCDYGFEGNGSICSKYLNCSTELGICKSLLLSVRLY